MLLQSMNHKSRRDRLGKTIAVGLMIAVVFTALAFGAVEPWSMFLFETIVLALIAIFALVQHFTWDGRFYWLRPTLATSPFGPFANHNHFAGYMELLIPLPVALVVAREGRGEIRLLYLFAAAMMGVAAVASLSRGGMISIAAGMMFIALLGVRLRREKQSSRV